MRISSNNHDGSNWTIRNVFKSNVSHHPTSRDGKTRTIPQSLQGLSQNKVPMK